jgi:CO/xanthine dehydrogenase FAD-binding subunit
VADIAIGGASLRETPIRCTATEQALLDRRLDAATIAAARTALAEDIAPIDDIRSTARYRAHVAGNLLDSMLVELSS